MMDLKISFEVYSQKMNPLVQSNAKNINYVGNCKLFWIKASIRYNCITSIHLSIIIIIIIIIMYLSSETCGTPSPSRFMCW